MGTPATARRFPRNPWPLVGIAAAFLLGALVAGLSVAVAESPPSASSQGACRASKVAGNTLPSVVTIAATGSAGSGTGSGEVIRSNGYILTNNHVISVAADGGALRVLFSNGVSAPASIAGRDPKTDLAVIKVNDATRLPVIPFANSNSVKVGEPVVVLGAPLGLSSTVTSGIVSALGRNIEVPGDNGNSALLVGAIQSDASINPGNSGGAMTNCAGQLIGVPTAGATVPNASGQASAGSVGLGFAIPSNLARSVADEIISSGRVTHSFFGLSVVPIPARAATEAGTSEGLFVTSVVDGGPAARAGLMAGDIITEVEGQAARDPNQLFALNLTRRAGDTVALTYERGGRSATATVTLGAQS